MFNYYNTTTMEQDILLTALTQLPERLMAFNHTIGSYCDHISTGRGITLRTSTATLFLYPLFIYKLLHKPESVTEDDLKSVALNTH
jgi:hypothetical protein